MLTYTLFISVRRRCFRLAVGLLALTLPAAAQNGTPETTTPGTSQGWFSAGAEAIAARAAAPLHTGRARNVILFVGDGMGLSTLTAARIYAGQKAGQPGEENYLSFERFPYTALIKTYNVNAQVSDSAGTASALNTGVKTRIGVINTPPDHPIGQCEGTFAGRLKTIAERAEARGMKTGLVSTTRLSHATPAAVYAVSPFRDWESDADLPAGTNLSECSDIASQITGTLGGNGLEVALGGGRRSFMPAKMGGNRKDGRDIPLEWQKRSNKSHYVETADDLATLTAANTERVLGLFSASHMAYELDRAATEEPSLEAMTRKAIELLSAGDTGYYLMVEAGRIDHAHHAGNAARALADTEELSQAVAAALDMVSLEDTLILVTADHSHTFTIAGYPVRGNPVLGLVREVPERGGNLAEGGDGKPYTTLGYANGPGAVSGGERPALTAQEAEHPDHRQQSTVPLRSETHGGEDVALFAAGPHAHLARGTLEQHAIYHLMAHALGWTAAEN